MFFLKENDPKKVLEKKKKIAEHVAETHLVLVKLWPRIGKGKFLVLGCGAVLERTKNKQNSSSLRKKWLSRKF